MTPRISAKVLATSLALAIPMIAMPAVASAETTTTTAAPTQISETVVQLEPELRTALNDAIAEEEVSARTAATDTPEVVAVRISEEEAVPLDAEGNEIQARFGWGDAWNATKCTAAVAAALVPGTAAFRAVRALGGVGKVVQIIRQAKTFDAALAALGGTAGQILGIAAVQEYCFS
ncbi:hypothetical protein ACTXKQ_15025 [Corynebacterium variabile]|uniref:Secreted protein n=2 Tax=Corynebacterium variabile TaxID=1727 RepID=A0A120N512_9CORY|nr:hypothetical protein [Corynebacterium variabile]AEK36733.1 putative secreted protein [Corynebacterium variabile DSM 44702]MDN6660026.1 hypothetical protein [Acidipropionibacterium jensenii]CUU67575.1 hypothetical protein CVAR292_02942 [Corynebacterium variabile]